MAASQHAGTESDASGAYVESASSSQLPRSILPERPVSLANSHPLQSSSQQTASDAIPIREREDSFDLCCTPGGSRFESSEAALDTGFTLVSDNAASDGTAHAFVLTKRPNFQASRPAQGDIVRSSDVAALPYVGGAVIPFNESNIQVPSLSGGVMFVTPQWSSGLTNVRPSRNRWRSSFEAYLDTRFSRLWDSGEAFTGDDLNMKAVSLRFRETFTEIFRTSWRMAESGTEMVNLARLTCGAADACMNLNLSWNTRCRYYLWYIHYNKQLEAKLAEAKAELYDKLCKGEMPDVLPMYIAVFLRHAAGTTMKGDAHINEAATAFAEFNQLTAQFPIVIRQPATSDDEAWEVIMCLADDPNDPGMRIGQRTMYNTLGAIRARFDREDGLI
ncbi:hypothetical protein E8E13_000172 [Curvularia kusanoi]|uniref:Uncharacterized protein n=1 Tax=Curvularia kusanoi TaxID=90978 RepID=A0A9P4W241_CURKU|nr:hypothetical protein E8E13_000172 [Curvularia kusanoi]